MKLLAAGSPPRCRSIRSDRPAKRWAAEAIRFGRLALAGWLVTAATSGYGVAAADPTDSSAPNPRSAESLGQLMRDAGNRYFGTAINSAPLSDDPMYKNLAVAQYNAVTAEREMKWDVTEPAPGVFDWTLGDAIADFAEQNGMLLRGHNIIWYQTTPSWVNNGQWTPDTLRAALKNHIDAVVGHYKGRAYSWDVVNEPLATPVSAEHVVTAMKQDVFYRVLGEDYIADAFQYAREADPHAKLYLNEALAEGSGPRADALYELVKRLIGRGVPIDGIGFESHFVTNPLGDVPADMAATMQRFADLGLDVAVTELDVAMPADEHGRTDPKDLDVQARNYASAVRACLQVARCVGVSTWGFTDRHSYLTSPNGSPSPDGIPGYAVGDLYDQNYQPKVAYYAVRNTLMAGSS